MVQERNPACLFQMGKTELSHQLPMQNNFQNNLPPHPPPLPNPLLHALFHPLKSGKDCILPASSRCSFQNCSDHRKRGGKTGKGANRSTASFGLWASHAKLKRQKQNIKLFNRIPEREFLQEPSATNSTFHLNLKVYKFPEVTDTLQFTVTKVITNREDPEDSLCFHW